MHERLKSATKYLKEAFSRPKKPVCLIDVYKKLDKSPIDFYGESHGGVVTGVEVTVEKVEESLVTKAWCHCIDKCGQKCYVIGQALKVGEDGKTAKVRMEEGKSYRVSGYTLADYYGRLIISN